MKFRLSTEIDGLESEERELALQRLSGLEAHLRHTYAVPVREDSRLAFLYATDRLRGWTRSDVGNELFVVGEIYNATDYGARIEEVMREAALRVRADYGLSWTEAWRVVRRYVPLMLKLHMASSCRLSFESPLPPSLVRAQSS